MQLICNFFRKSDCSLEQCRTENIQEKERRYRTSWAVAFLVLMNVACVQSGYAATIEGYLSSFSVLKGDAIDIHASTTAANYDIAVYRNGPGDVELVSTFEGLSGGVYATPDEGWLGADWPVAHTLQIPAHLEGGLYTIRLKTEDASVDLNVIVREGSPGNTSDMLVLDSTPTTVAYNNWGGKSLYDHNSTDSDNTHSLSLGRPGQNTFPEEILELDGWLQSLGISAEYATMFDLHAEQSLLSNYQVVVLVGHNEYWTYEMRSHFDDFLANGGNAIILSGNTMWWQIRIEGDLLVCYKDEFESDPLFNVDNDLVTANWHSYPVNDPENRSIGLSFRNGGVVNSEGLLPHGAGYGGFNVINSDHWVFKGTGLQENDILGYEHTIVGEEVDGAELNWIDGTPTVTGNDGTPSDFIVLGYSEAILPSTQAENFGTMGIFHHPVGGGRVFNAATIDWSDGLWSLTDKRVADFSVSQITYNVVSDFTNQYVPLSFYTASLPSFTVDTPGGEFIRVTGGQASYSWSVSAGSLPTGLALDSSTGELHGVATEVGSWAFDISVTDDAEDTVSASYTVVVVGEVLYEDAEDGTTVGWSIFDSDPAGATINNVFDPDRGSQVIELSGSGMDNGFRLRQADGSGWKNSAQSIYTWSMKFSTDFIIYVEVETTAGQRLLMYTPVDGDYGGAGINVHSGLGASAKNGQWQTFTRDLQADLEAAQPGVIIEEVNGLWVRGSGRLDDIKLLNALPLMIDTTEIPGGLHDKSYSADVQVSGGQTPYTWTVTSGSLPSGLALDSSTGQIQGIATEVGSWSFDITVTDDAADTVSTGYTIVVEDEMLYEDAEDGTTLGWTVFDSNPAGAAVNNVFDPVRGSQVIVLTGSGLDNGFRLLEADGSSWQNSVQTIFTWSMQFSTDFIIYVDVETTAGQRLLMYTPVDGDYGGAGKNVHSGLGASASNGQWQTYTRDLQADLSAAQPAAIIEEVNGLWVRGSGRVDDIKLLNALPLTIDTTEFPGGLQYTSYSEEVQVSGGQAPYHWSVSGSTLPAGLTLDSSTGEIQGIALEVGSWSFGITVTDDAADTVSANYTIVIEDEVLYEDAEDGTTLGWTIVDDDPAGAAVNNVFDPVRGSQVIELTGSGLDNGFRLLEADGSSWQNSVQTIFTWSMQFSTDFIVSVDMETTAGQRFLIYTPVDSDYGGAGINVHTGLGASSGNGQWQTFTRDLQADLEAAQPGAIIEEVTGLLIRGSGRLDDIKLLNTF
jgi:hypothetical protein